MIDVRLSRDIEVRAIARPRYATDIIELESGSEFRVPRWRYPKFSFEFNLQPGDPNDRSSYENQTLQEFIDLWHAAGGMGDTFKFRHWSDFSAEEQEIGVGDGVTRTFQLFKNYSAGAVTRQRKITRPVLDTVTVYVEGVPTAVTIDYATGGVTFAVAPIDSALITADFEFDVPVRFDSDELELVALTRFLDVPVNIQLIEVRERGVAA
jgi:uncharacterized protein (TIGR02217 family)